MNLSTTGILLITFFILPIFGLDKKELETDKKTARAGKVFSLFSIVTFKNSGCRSTSGTTGTGVNRNGTCYTSTECQNKGGTASGNCAAGFGVCCLFTTQTSGTISENCSYIQNPGFPSTYTTSSTIQWTIAKCAVDVCSLRLDFESFTTAGPTSTDDSNACIDTFQVTASPSGDASNKICGEMGGEHIYIDIGPDSGANAQVSFSFGTNTASVSRSWEIKVTQIECWSNARPYDSGCDQYFTGTTGRIQSYNFGQTSSSSYQHLSAQRQNICIRQEAGFCCIQYNSCSDPNSYAFDNKIAADNGDQGSNCSQDYIEISGVSATCDAGSNGAVIGDRLCGTVLTFIDGTGNTSPIVCDCTAPFQVQFRSNANAQETIQTIAQRGFCLEYKQLAC